ncbi:MAG: class I SAM-dependent methyltransferase [Bacillota bacterium]
MAINTNRWNQIRYTLFAPIYDLIASFGSQRRRSISLLDPRPGESVLIVGAGTGADLPYLPPGLAITAGDITPAMVERLRWRAGALGQTVEARVMDGHALDLPDSSVDCVILHLILAVIPDPVAAAREVDRVLKPGGRAVIFDKFVPDEAPVSAGRRALNLLTNLVFSDITRKLGPILKGTGLRIIHQEPAMLGGSFQIILLKKEVQPST